MGRVDIRPDLGRCHFPHFDGSHSGRAEGLAVFSIVPRWDNLPSQGPSKAEKNAYFFDRPRVRIPSAPSRFQVAGSSSLRLHLHAGSPNRAMNAAPYCASRPGRAPRSSRRPFFEGQIANAEESGGALARKRSRRRGYLWRIDARHGSLPALAPTLAAREITCAT